MSQRSSRIMVRHAMRLSCDRSRTIAPMLPAPPQAYRTCRLHSRSLARSPRSGCRTGWGSGSGCRLADERSSAERSRTVDCEGQAGTTKRCLVLVECEQRHVVRLDEVVDPRRGAYQVVHFHHGDVALEPAVTHPDD